MASRSEAGWVYPGTNKENKGKPLLSGTPAHPTNGQGKNQGTSQGTGQVKGQPKGQRKGQGSNRTGQGTENQPKGSKDLQKGTRQKSHGRGNQSGNRPNQPESGESRNSGNRSGTASGTATHHGQRNDKPGTPSASNENHQKPRQGKRARRRRRSSARKVNMQQGLEQGGTDSNNGMPGIQPPLATTSANPPLLPNPTLISNLQMLNTVLNCRGSYTDRDEYELFDDEWGDYDGYGGGYYGDRYGDYFGDYYGDLLGDYDDYTEYSDDEYSDEYQVGCGCCDHCCQEPAGVTEYGGYDYEFCDPLPDEYPCQVCTLVQRDPHQVTCCGKIFCKSCLDKLAVNNSTCPNCRSRSIKDKKYFPDMNTARKIKHLKIYCTNKDRGCKWVGYLKDLDSGHIPECPNENVFCTNRRQVPEYEQQECGQTMERYELDKHMREECQWRLVCCDHCGDEGSFSFISSAVHIDVCPKLILPCENDGCVMEIERCLMDTHREFCPKEKVPCQYHSIGCQATITREQIHDHNKNNTEDHLGMTFNALGQALKRIEALEIELAKK